MRLKGSKEMPEFKYNGKTITYHSFSEDVDQCIIPLGAPKGKKLALYEFASHFGSPDSRGFRFKVLWMEYGDESVSDKAFETMQMMKASGCEKSNFLIFDREGAEIAAELYRQWPECIEKLFADDMARTGIKEAIKDTAGMPEIEYYGAPVLEDLIFAIKSSIFGKKMNCPYCGETMQMGYVYAFENIQAYWTMDPDLVGNGSEFSPEGRVLPLRENFKGYGTFGELFRRTSPEDVSKGYLCRRCGKMVIDMSPVMIHFRDKAFFEANDLPEDLDESIEIEKDSKIQDAFSVWGDTLKGVFARDKRGDDLGRPETADKIEREEKKLEKKLSSEDGKKKRKLSNPFSRDPKVE